MKYKYFISYAHQTGFGCGEYWSDKKISDWDNIQAMKKFIDERYKLDCVIINWKLLK